VNEMRDRQAKVVITGAAGLVGQNLLVELKSQGYTHLVAIRQARTQPGSPCAGCTPTSKRSAPISPIPATGHKPSWMPTVWWQLHAQITGKHAALFTRNNIEATRQVIDACRRHQVKYLVHVSSSVVNSVATDDYTETKKAQEALVASSGLPHCVLRPTLIVTAVRPEAPRLVGAIHGEDAGVSDSRRRQIHAPAVVRTGFSAAA